MKNKTTTITICEQEWTVVITDSHDSNLVCGSDVCRGCTWSGKQIIYVSNELTKHTLRRVLMHELVHATLYATQVSTPGEYTEEQLAEFCAIYGQSIVEEAHKLERWSFSDEDNSSI